MFISGGKPHIFFIGLAKNCSLQLAFGLHGLTPLFLRYRVSGVIITEDNTDHTAAILNNWNIHMGNKLFFPKYSLVSGLSRYDKMASLRNLGLEYASEEKPDIICMADLDLPSFQGLSSYEPCLKHSIETAVGLYPYDKIKSWYPKTQDGGWAYYDLLALEYKNGTRPSWTGADGIDYPDTDFAIKKSDPFVEIAEGYYNSSFGGLGFYRYENVKNLRYAGGDCEHVSFNKCAGGTYINPEIVTLYNFLS